MDDEKTIAEEIADEAANTIDEADIDEAKANIEDAEDIDSDEVRDEIRDEDDDTRGDIDKVIDRLDEIARRIDEKIDGLSRMILDGGAVINDGREAPVVDAADGYVDFDDMDLDID